MPKRLIGKQPAPKALAKAKGKAKAKAKLPPIRKKGDDELPIPTGRGTRRVGFEDDPGPKDPEVIDVEVKEEPGVSEVRRCHVVDLRPLELLFLRHRAEAVEIDLRGNRVEGEKLRREMTRGTTMTTIM